MSQLSILDGKKKEIVEQILVQHPSSRDCDYDLTARFWIYEMRKKKIRTNLIQSYQKKLLTSSDVITRFRRDLQKHKPELRGEQYAERKNYREPKVRQAMKGGK